MYYDKLGQPMELFDWARRFNNFDYKRVAKDILPNGTVISTVWLGMDHGFGEGKPLIFETMVFLSEADYREEDIERYSTEEEAKTGHKRMVEKWRNK